MATIRERFESVLRRINAACIAAPSRSSAPRLVAVSKFKSEEAILELYNCGVRVFGENRIEELHDKASKLPKDIEWHFIGTIQTNKITTLLSVPNLSIIESVDSLEHAKAIEAKLIKHHPGRSIKVFMQVNTSGEASKHGFDPDQVLAQFETIKSTCPHLVISGLMNIGSIEQSHNAQGRNRDFELLVSIRNSLQAIADQPFELSMGMSGDFEEAVTYI